MRKFLTILMVIFCLLGIVACKPQSQQVHGSQLLANGNVTKIDITSRPEEYNYTFTGEKSKEIIDYLSGLNLQSNFQENPDTYAGMTWVISLDYENGDTLTIYHFGNTFIRSEKSSWYKMTYKEASRFDSLLNKLNN